MPRKAKSKARKLIEHWVEGKDVEPTMLDPGVVYLSPSRSEPLPAYHTTAQLVDHKSGREYWVCSCKGFRFSHDDTCAHIKALEGDPKSVRRAK